MSSFNTLIFIIPIVAIIFGCGIAIIAIIAEHQEKRKYYESLVKALETGKDPEMVRTLFEQPRQKEFDIPRYLRKGIVTIAVGIGLGIMGIFVNADFIIGIGIFLCILGLAFLLIYYLVKKNRPE
ncbi:hypothetical protein BXT86_00650 [candidate division WOR-3 bacterium 4484_100]|uniref:DUF6249 domain-containing protein n=1 Tax=candidate division WOR-3 bacterium 4484_100 TaxID=1936077 RepID=A0A1V4QGT3_UNCW3|nr:MAG: hypothetical protein BXT86_00650 [candidate division WOR-3 bacterium 4484_100]